ncbi:poly-gamma-glutamate system protein [Leptospira kmetyi]|uniref:poly-gamma-glutamate system protein n=1 Tax=Leptospira kmetyi TaxID=408139 RepID=UPI0010845818|nr:poly-gamma-glutamate system protein [Leptospira kmetyi]TGK13781.1 poly-gamma-glutamate system protein [Leptospira kmetyi]TGK29401.1 poly-gamma-glutamate system protein [Leptospira kmetyi]
MNSAIAVVLLCSVSFGFVVWIETVPIVKEADHAVIKKEASQRAYNAFQKIKEWRLSQNVPIDPTIDPARTGWIGLESSPVTSSSGKLSSKQASIHPDFAVWFLDRFQNAGLKPGDTIAVGMSGSFPALNVCFWIAADTMRLNVISIASVASSQYGANHPDLLWPDLENRLYQENSIFQKSVFMSIGGISDLGIGIGKEGREKILNSIRKNGYAHLSSDSFEDSLIQRKKIYDQKPVSLYVNIGGGTISSGTSLGKKKIPKGTVIGEDDLAVADLPDSILKNYLLQKIPVLHVSGIETIAKESGMKYESDRLPSPGSSDLIFKKEKNRWLAGFLFVLLSAMIWKLSPWISLTDTKKENSFFL